ncbi:hypothetical protein Sjap_013083 [Stephania japonica]|uniref:Uncharacterized protein n=1 Tax=Stephania japonica TaxID=461633 RepID=A0AAP0IZQ3_9MAGN
MLRFSTIESEVIPKRCSPLDETIFPIKTWKCSPSLICTVASLLAIVSIVHLLFFPLVPSLDNLRAPKARKSCFPVHGSTAANLSQRFYADSHKAVVYRGAPWREQIGQWLLSCHSATATIDVVEILFTDAENKWCFHGYAGQYHIPLLYPVFLFVIYELKSIKS